MRAGFVLTCTTINWPPEFSAHQIQRDFLDVPATRKGRQSTCRFQPSKCGHSDSKRTADSRDSL